MQSALYIETSYGRALIAIGHIDAIFKIKGELLPFAPTNTRYIVTSVPNDYKYGNIEQIA